MGDVIRLIDSKPVACGDAGELKEWADAWISAICNGEFGGVRSLVLVAETDDGQVRCASQSTGAMDMPRLVGLLTVLANRKMHGCGHFEAAD